MVRFRVSVRVNSCRDSFSVLLRAQHYSMFGRMSHATECPQQYNIVDV